MKDTFRKPRHSISRRSVIAGAVGASVVAATSFPKPAIARPLYQWKMVLAWPSVLPGLGTGAVRLARRIESLSGGKIEINIFGAGELVPATGIFDAVADGTAQLGHSASYYWQSKTPAATYFCAIPGGLIAQEQNAWLQFGGGQALWDELYAPFGLRAFAAGNTGTQMGGWYNRELTSPEDIRGLKIRMPGLAGRVFEQLGANVQTIPPQDLFAAMQSGAIDAVEWTGPWNDMSLGLHRVSQFYYGPGFHEAGPTLEMMVNKKAHDALPEDLQQAIRIACAVENEMMLSEYVANNIRAFDTLKTTQPLEIRRYPDGVLDALLSTSRAVVAENAASGDALTQRIHQSYSEFLRQASQMSNVTELPFLQARHKLYSA